MAKIKYRVVTPYGTFTRESNRVYTHIVVASGANAAYYEKKTQEYIAYTKKQIRIYEQIVNGERPRPLAQFSIEEYANDLAEYREHLERAAEQYKPVMERKNFLLSESRGESLGFCGRLDLARKLARKEGESYAVVKIYSIDTGKEVQ